MTAEGEKQAGDHCRPNVRMGTPPARNSEGARRFGWQQENQFRLVLAMVGLGQGASCHFFGIILVESPHPYEMGQERSQG